MSAAVTLDRDLLRRFPLPRHPEDGDKEDRGRLLVIAGSRELSGAALLAGLAGLRVGVGKLQIATAASVAVAIGTALPEARLIGCEETQEGCLAADSADSLTKWARDAQAVTIGCGLQHGPPLEELLDALFGEEIAAPLVLDATVLGCLASRSEALRNRKGEAIVLPHAREMARMLDCELEEVRADPLAAAKRAASLFNVVALIKGQWSYIVDPQGRSFRFEGGGIGLATSGSGDTLAGIVGGLCARGADPLTATLWGVYLHGEAGRQLTKEIGRIGFLARQIVDRLPGLLED